jgi:hypothetical protein
MIRVRAAPERNGRNVAALRRRRSRIEGQAARITQATPFLRGRCDQSGNKRERTADHPDATICLYQPRHPTALMIGSSVGCLNGRDAPATEDGAAVPVGGSGQQEKSWCNICGHNNVVGQAVMAVDRRGVTAPIGAPPV